MKAFGILGIGSVVLASAVPAGAQQVPATAPAPSQAAQTLQQAVQQQPGLADVIRQRVQQSGMTPDQIRARLQASGYPSNLLDAYMATPSPSQPASTPGARELAAIQALGLPPITGADTFPVDTGLIRGVRRAPAPQPDTTPVVFGADVFRRTTTQFLPLLSGPVPADYRLGPGDQLVLILTGDVELAYNLQVTREGFVLIPQVGQVFVANLTLDELRSLLFTRLGRVYSGVRRGAGATTQFDVSVASVRAVQVYVVGEVAQPGAYQISSLGTVLSALYAAGGITDRGGMRGIRVERAGNVVASFDLYDYLLRGNTRNDIRLQTGDVVYVGLHGTRARVRGAVRRPAFYELGERESLADLIAAAGGFRADAALERVLVERIVPPTQRSSEAAPRVFIDVALARSGDSVLVPPFAVEDGDVISIDSISPARRNYVQIRGSVFQPGRYGFEPGMRLSRLVRLAGGFRPATYAGRAHIHRLNVSDSTRTIVAVALPRDSTAPWPDDLELQDYDSVTIYGRPEMRDTMYVAIAGMVNEPGRYPWQEGMTLRDLALMARGMKFGADLREAEIARMPEDRTHGQLATTLRVPLDSTYLFDRDSLGRYVGPPGLAFRANGAPEVRLQLFDNVLILRQPDFELQRTVQILGQVRYPGTYALRTTADRLSSLIERAGGLTERAYPQGIRFYRPLANAGRINVDLQKALRDRNSSQNVLLQVDDSIVIPEYVPSVRVDGAVNSPGSVLWRRGATLSDYIAGAGGFARLADKGGASVRQANGTVQKARHVLLLFRSEPEPGPGAVVFVPSRDPSDRTDYATLIGGIAQTLVSLATMVVVLSKL